MVSKIHQKHLECYSCINFDYYYLFFYPCKIKTNTFTIISLIVFWNHIELL